MSFLILGEACYSGVIFRCYVIFGVIKVRRWCCVKCRAVSFRARSWPLFKIEPRGREASWRVSIGQRFLETLQISRGYNFHRNICEPKESCTLNIIRFIFIVLSSTVKLTCKALKCFCLENWWQWLQRKGQCEVVLEFSVGPRPPPFCLRMSACSHTNINSECN